MRMCTHAQSKAVWFLISPKYKYKYKVKMAVRETVKSKLQSNLNDFSALTR